MYYPYFRFGCGLTFDVNRTKAYLDPSSEDTHPICSCKPNWAKASLSCSCPALDWDFCCGCPAEPPTVKKWTAPDLDGAEWYDPDVVESVGFMGYMIESIEGMDGKVGKRKLKSRASGSGGGILGSYRLGGRTLKVTALMFACDECSMEYGFRYLANQLADLQCGGCDLCDAEVLTCCTDVCGIPTYDELTKGRWQLRDVGLVEGPVWGETPIDNLACYVRRVEFTVASEQPWLYSCERPIVEEEPLSEAVENECDIESWLCEPAKLCTRMEESSPIGETAFRVLIEAATQLDNIRITVTPDQFGFVCEGEQYVEPCAEIIIPTIPEGYTFELDTASRKMTVTRPGGSTADGTSWIQTEPGVSPTWPVATCGKYTICIESDRCGPDESESLVSIWTVHREL